MLLCVPLLLMSCNGSLMRPAESVTSPNPTLISKPTLSSLKTLPDGGISMNKHDAAELLIYIEALEKACGVGL